MSDGLITVTPVYGHGWFQGAEPMSEVPPPFKLKLDTCAEKVWNGQVVSIDHPFQGRHVELSQRHVEWSGAVNVVVRRPTDVKAATADVTGFASLDQRPRQVR
jgi:hypothetical protein